MRGSEEVARPRCGPRAHTQGGGRRRWRLRRRRRDGGRGGIRCDVCRDFRRSRGIRRAGGRSGGRCERGGRGRGAIRFERPPDEHEGEGADDARSHSGRSEDRPAAATSRRRPDRRPPCVLCGRSRSGCALRRHRRADSARAGGHSLGHVPELREHRLGAGGSRVGLLREGPHHERLDLGRNGRVRSSLAQRNRARLDVARHDDDGVVVREWRAAGEHVIEDDAQRVEVASARRAACPAPARATCSAACRRPCPPGFRRRSSRRRCRREASSRRRSRAP